MDSFFLISWLLFLVLVSYSKTEAASPVTKGMKLGERIRLFCFPNEKPETLNRRLFRWLINGTVVRPDDRIQFRKRNTVLKMKDATRRDIGEYTCQEITGNIKKEVIVYKVEFDVEDQNALQFTRFTDMKIQSHIVMPSGDVLKLDCKAIGKEPIRYSWYKDGKILLTRRVDSSLVTDRHDLILKDLVPSDSATYTCKVENNFKVIQHNFTLTVQEKTRTSPYLEKGEIKNQTEFVGTNATIPCYELISGTLPDFRWLRWKGKENHTVLNTIATGTSKFNKSVVEVLQAARYKQVSKKSHRSNDQAPLYGVELVFSNITEADEGFYTCLVTNHIGHDYKTMYLTVKKSNTIEMTQPEIEESSTAGNETMMIIIAVLGILVFISLLVLAWLFFKSYFKGKKGGHKNDTPLGDLKINIDPPDKNPRALRLRNFSSGGSGAMIPLLNGGSVRSNSESRALYGDLDDVFEIPFDPEWEVDRNLFVITETLGEGAFGVVVKATASGLVRGEEQHTTVAIKMLKADATENELMDLLSEMDTMKHIGQHKNIINFLGCCTQQDPVYVIVEFAPNGNLRQFLRSKRPPPSDSDQRMDPLLSAKDMVSFSLQISKGMDYLASRKCIHRDLAARNILVGDDYVIKIADFGLARSVHEVDYYRKTTDGRLPIKWLAIEALFDRVYTTQSDVWAFGVLLWEIFTLGGSPYPGIPVERLFDLLKSGYRMEKPEVCPKETYEIMVKCWYENPTHRPSFADLCIELELLLEELTSQDYILVKASSKKSVNDGDESSDYDDENDDDEDYPDETSLILDEDESRPFPFSENLQQHFHPPV
ncbi:fibroblast growth factor receptor 2-like isoform X2 [Clytia hemisphaerica]|uniref:receptor protein-tyrosine kinase n=1 Tax=Clytia hemisphaerica TaxID=252671 RepID=A0A7M5TWW3_9CNID